MLRLDGREVAKMSKEIKEIYPLTVILDRYNGVYSDAKYLAFNMYPDLIPYGVMGDDMDCSDFWGEKHTFPIGKGNTAQEAIDNLYSLMYGVDSNESRTIPKGDEDE